MESVCRLTPTVGSNPTLSATSVRVVDFPSLEFMVSVLVAAVRGCKPRRRTHSHANLSQKSLFMWLLGANIEKRRSPEVRWWRGRHSHPHNKKKMKIGKERKVASGHVESDLRYHRQRSPMSPSIYIIAGPNGVGKTTFAREFLPNYANCRHFISADPIAVAVPIANQRSVFRRLFSGRENVYAVRWEPSPFSPI